MYRPHKQSPNFSDPSFAQKSKANYTYLQLTTGNTRKNPKRLWSTLRELGKSIVVQKISE